jgi:hypothetical protein
MQRCFEPDAFQVVRYSGRLDGGLPFIVNHRFHRSSECTLWFMSGLADWCVSGKLYECCVGRFLAPGSGIQRRNLEVVKIPEIFVWFNKLLCYYFIINSSCTNARGKYLIFDNSAWLFKCLDRRSSVIFLTLNIRTFCSVPHRRVCHTTWLNSYRGKENALSVLV